ncbi:MAG: RNA-binding S4 domain-containing protein [Thiotrichales bacterium]|nr:RNA-binding S4 domain-containing protein [Thiotrichales bacterium]
MEPVRIDKWLWAARFFKTRGLAAEALKGGKVELNGHKPKPSKALQVGDKLKITQPQRQVEVTVLLLSSQRGSAEQAQLLYQLDSERLNHAKPNPETLLHAYRDKGAGRPTKRDRRLIERFMG